jgi:cell shape-determining protein MreD
MERVLLRVVVPALVVLHLLLHLGFGLGAGAPDLIVVALLFAARQVSMGWASGLGFFLGLLEDAVSVLSFGANTVTLTVVGVLGSGTRDLFVGDSRWFVLVYLGVGKWLRDLGHWLLAGEGIREPFWNTMLLEATAGALYAATIGTLILLALERGWRR